MPFNSFKWEGPYQVVKVLSHSYYIVRKIGTFKAQCVHRMRLRPFVPHNPIEDITGDAIRHYSDSDAVDDQTLFNDVLTELEQSTPAEITGEVGVNETENVDNEHRKIYYERKQVHDVPPLPNPLTENIREEKTHNKLNAKVQLIE